jgi:hypothetical protein
LRKRTLIHTIAFVAVLAATANIALATETHVETRHMRHGPSISTVSEGLPSYIPHLGTFVGDISALRVRGVGNFFYLSKVLNGMGQPYIRPKAKIIHVDSTSSACSMENSVCVIRP